MDRRDSLEYRKRVDELMKTLRWRCLGLDIPLTAILPEQHKGLPPEGQASCLARQILFQVTRQNLTATQEELKRSFQWLCAIVLYLLTECNEEDQVFGNLVRIVELDYFTRENLFDRFGELTAGIRNDLFIPTPLESLELTFLSLLDGYGRLSDGKRVCRLIRELIG